MQHIILIDSKVESPKPEVKSVSTAEDIDVKSNYSEKDIEKLHHLNFAAGIAPYLRGALCYHVCPKALDDSPICRVFYSRG